MFQLVFKVTPDGNRTVYSPFIYPSFDLKDCDPVTHRYKGPLDNLGGYMHSITSTKDAIILPVTSMVSDPCSLRFGYLINPLYYAANVVDPRNSSQVAQGLYYEPKQPLRYYVRAVPLISN